jgi:hypothetical protein
MKIFTFIFLSVASFISCNPDDKSANKIDQNAKMDTLLKDWQKDSLNCKGTRTEASLKAIVKWMNGKKEKKTELIKLLGKSYNIPSKNGELFCYYVTPGCYSTKRDNRYTCVEILKAKDSIIIDGVPELVE